MVCIGISYATKESHDINWKFEVMLNFFTIRNASIFTIGKVIFGGGVGVGGGEDMRVGINLRCTLTYVHSFS